MPRIKINLVSDFPVLNNFAMNLSNLHPGIFIIFYLFKHNSLPLDQILSSIKHHGMPVLVETSQS